jgi:hypothetical protein
MDVSRVVNEEKEAAKPRETAPDPSENGNGGVVEEVLEEDILEEDVLEEEPPENDLPEEPLEEPPPSQGP